MIKHTISILLLAGSLISQAQTFTKSSGTTVGNQKVISIPIAPGAPTKQALIYLPDDYGKTTKRYPVFFFLHGSGEASTDISKINNTSLPYLIAQGLKPYAIDSVTKDTIKFIVISPQCSEPGGNCSYSQPQLKYTIPFCLQNYRIDTNCVWAGGLSAGGSATFSLGMADTGFTMKYITGLMPMANGGWNDNFAAFGKNLAYCAQRGLAMLYVIGTNDPGDNAIGFQAYDKLMNANAKPGRYFSKEIIGGTHSTNVWNTPFPLTARVWSTTQNSWNQMWALRRNSNVAPPVVVPPVTIPPVTTIPPYPVRILIKYSDSSCTIIWQKP